MMLESEFDIKQVVYLVTDTEQKQRIITAVCFRPTGVTYCLACGEEETWHYDFEISKEKDVLITSDN